jgi:putative ubiquitin-RnfH superfamily antitoxin RatB of RatAB toxin-antitoxin module
LSGGLLIFWISDCATLRGISRSGCNAHAFHYVMDSKHFLQIEVVYAQAEAQVILALYVPSGATVRDAISLSGLTERFPELAAMKQSVGIYGKTVAMDRALRAGDRVELYRPLIADPKHARRRRAAAKRIEVQPTRHCRTATND